MKIPLSNGLVHLREIMFGQQNIGVNCTKKKKSLASMLITVSVLFVWIFFKFVQNIKDKKYDSHK